ncbi:polymer-forming cytoskeletal protein [Coprobacillus cateniformis]|nr:polymer-forming cytoskeletal protein [Coprobacillus cateniformis]
MDKKSSFKNKILDRYFEVVEDEVITESPITSTVDNMEQSEVRVETASVTDEVSVVKTPTIISSETVLQGNVNGSKDLEVCGQIIGDITVEGMVKVLSGAVTGNIKATKIFIKDSIIDGNIDSDSMIDIIGKSEINGNIKGGDIVINGRCKGNIVASEHLKLLERAMIRGDLQTKLIRIEDGAILEGYLKMI